MNIVLPEQTEHGEILVDIYSKLAADRILFIHDYIDDRVATDIMATLILKDSEDSNQKISLFINSGGGDIRSIFMIYDTIKILQSPIETICVGSAYDESVLLLAVGHPGMRYATKNSLIAPGQLISGGTMMADLEDAFILMDRIKRDNKSYMTALAKCTKKTLKQVMIDFERQKFFTAKQALQYGIIDSIVEG